MINNVVLVGRITRDLELKYTQNNRAVVSFSIAVNRQFKNPQGQYDADFINVVAWGQTAEYLTRYANKGSLIGVTGRIQTRNYDNQQGQRVYVTEVVAESIQLLESRAQREERAMNPSYNNASSNQASYTNNTAPSNSYNSPSGNSSMPNFGRNDSLFGGGDAPIDIPDDDLPF